MAYCLAGLTLKLGDDLLDKSNYPELAWLPFLASGLLFGLLMTVSEWDLVLLTAIIIGVLFSGKVNRKEFIIGFVAIVIVITVIGLPYNARVRSLGSRSFRRAESRLVQPHMP